MLNGGTFDMTAYAAHSKLLAEKFTVIRLEQFNTQYATEGRTLPKKYSVSTESEAVKATLDSLHITEPVVLVGHSYGGVIAFDFALNNPGRVRALVLIEAPLFHLAKTKGKLTAQMKQIENLTKRFTPEATITEDMVWRFRCALSNCDSVDVRTLAMWPKWVAQKDRLRGLSANPAYKVDLKKLHAFAKPVLVVTGSATIAPNKITDGLLAKEFSNAKAAGLAGGHTAIYQSAERFADLLKTFLSEKGDMDAER
ncbi:MAG: alpha/beta hydrolase [Cytophagales bacterium]|nr:alpha/beta hydrolase [Cytophagales bacterium]